MDNGGVRAHTLRDNKMRKLLQTHLKIFNGSHNGASEYSKVKTAMNSNTVHRVFNKI